ncbi:RDD family protein [Neolewinella antarctica]|uniref:RDD family membrane protein YckC n=1 Tax=Neolewinella antarctica TaxID=442734 RepID=A0ABX0XF26_9BACT|nr:RDD family protein [Neolewinella antarctica]NJC27478.1 putative RDD family membrane protein YckC [Neolewinella antarctica]
MPLDTITIQTTQNVSIDYDLAKVGARIGSFLIDAVIVIVAFWLLVLVVNALGVNWNETLTIAVGPVTYFILYFFLFETFNRGQTPGKKLIGLKVIRHDGRDPTPGDFLARAVFLFVDVILTAGMAAVLLISTSKNKQRLGDMTAGTVVIQANNHSIFSLEEIMGIKDRSEYEPIFPGVQRFTDQDMMVVKQSLNRLRKYQNSAHRQAIRQLSLRIAGQLGLEASEVNLTPEKFLETVLMDYIVITR